MMSLFNINLISNLLNHQETAVFLSMLSIERKMNTPWKDSFIFAPVPGLDNDQVEPLIFHMISMNKHTFISIIPVEAFVILDEKFMSHCCEHATSSEMVSAIYPKIHSLLSEKPSLLFKTNENSPNPIQLTLKEKNDLLLERLLHDVPDLCKSAKLSDELQEFPLTLLFGQATLSGKKLENLYDYAADVSSSESVLRVLRKFGAHLFSTHYNTLIECFNSANTFRAALENNSESSRGPEIVKNKKYWNKLFWELIIFHALNPLHLSKYKALSASLGNRDNAQELLTVNTEPELLRGILLLLTKNEVGLSLKEQAHREKLSNRLIKSMEYIADIDETDKRNQYIMLMMVIIPIFAMCIYAFYVGDTARKQYNNESQELKDNFHQCMSHCETKPYRGPERRSEANYEYLNATNFTASPSESPNHHMRQPCTTNTCGVGNCGEGADWYAAYKALHRLCKENRSLNQAILLPTSFFFILNVITLGLITDNPPRLPHASFGFLALKAAPRTVLSFSGRYTDVFPFDGKDRLISALKLLLNCEKTVIGAHSEHSLTIDRLANDLNKPVHEIGYRTLVDALTLAKDFVTQYLYHINTIPRALAIKLENLVAAKDLLAGGQALEQDEEADVEAGAHVVAMMPLL